MNNLTSKFTLYDIISIILPGGLLLWCLSLWDRDIIDAFIRVSNLSQQGEAVKFIVFVVISYLVGLLLDSIVSFLWRPLRNNISTISEIYHKKRNNEHLENLRLDRDLEINDYYACYEYVQQECKNNPIPIIESQVNMLKNMIIPMAMFTATIVFNEWECPCSKECVCFCRWYWSILIGLLCGIVPLVLAIIRQHKIYNLVFDHYEYLQKIDKIK